MQLMAEIDDLGFSPSFSCYSSDGSTAAAAEKVSREVMQEEDDAQFQESIDVDEQDFQFSFEFSGEEISAKELARAGRLLFPVFTSDLLTKDEVNRTVKVIDDDSSAIIPLQKLFLGDSDESSSSSEADEPEGRASGTSCMSWPKAGVESPTLAKCKKSRSTGSGSKSWRFRDLLRRSNSAGKEAIFFLCPKKVEATRQQRNVKSGEVPKVSRKSKTAPSYHELFYVQKRAQQRDDKMKSYLPYKQDLLGFFVNVNGIGNKKLSS